MGSKGVVYEGTITRKTFEQWEPQGPSGGRGPGARAPGGRPYETGLSLYAGLEIEMSFKIFKLTIWNLEFAYQILM